MTSTHAEIAALVHCPGDGTTISRAVHLGRLASFWPPCRACPHRADTGVVSRRRAEQIRSVCQRKDPAIELAERGAWPPSVNRNSPTEARRLAAAFGLWLRGALPDQSKPPMAVASCDGSPHTAVPMSAVVEGMRWAGCDVVDLGATTSPCTAFALRRLPADGGIMVSDDAHGSGKVRLRFWAPGTAPLGPGPWERIRGMAHADLDRPARTFGSLRSFRAEGPYLAGFEAAYHALRPLSIVAASPSAPFLRYWRSLAERVGCRIAVASTGSVGQAFQPDALPIRVNGIGVSLESLTDAERPHFAAHVTEDGESATIFDEAAREIPSERLFLLLAGHLLAERPGSRVIAEKGTPASVVRALQARGAAVTAGGSDPVEMQRLVRDHQAVLGGGPSGRFWYNRPEGHAAADALVSLTLLLAILSRSDRPLSQVLDAATALD